MSNFDIDNLPEKPPIDSVELFDGSEKRHHTLGEIAQAVADMAYEKLMKRIGDEIAPQKGHEGWVNFCVYEELDTTKLYTGGHYFPTREAADGSKNMGHKRIACIKVKFTEGEGL